MVTENGRTLKFSRQGFEEGVRAMLPEDEVPVNDEQDVNLQRDFIRIDRTEAAIGVFVCEIDWPDPSQPVATWQRVATLPANSPESVVAQQVDSVLANPAFFAVCAECGERNPLGWMTDWEEGELICQRCAEQNHHVVW